MDTPESLSDSRLLAFWGKSNKDHPDNYHPLICHLLDIAALCAALLPRFGAPPGLTPAWTVYITALHDIGKLSPYFQAKDQYLAEIMHSRTGMDFVAREHSLGFRHEALSAVFIDEQILDEKEWGAQAIETIVLAIKGHHGNFAASQTNETPTEAKLWNPIRRQFSSLLAELIEVEDTSIEGFEDANTTGLILSGLIVLSDWISSNSDLYPYFDRTQLDPEAGLAVYYQQAKRIAVQVVDKLGLTQAPATVVPTSFSDIWPGFTKLTPIQSAIESLCTGGACPGLTIIEAQMGQGKTETAVYLAEYLNSLLGHSGCYIALPSQATSNQMFMRYRGFLKSRRPTSLPRLIHGMAWLLDDDAAGSVPEIDSPDSLESARAQQWFANAKRALIAPDGVGTVDQAMMAALHVKHGFLRLLGLTKRVLIIDEVHAYDAYMSTILERLITYCNHLSVPVILLSATLSHTQRESLVTAYTGKKDNCTNVTSYPLITTAEPGGTVTEIAVDPGPQRQFRIECHEGYLLDDKATAELAVLSVENGGCACVIANTVKAAQSIYLKVRSNAKGKGIKVVLFHARFTAEKRSDIEKKVVGLFGKEAGKTGKPSRPKRAILIATQVVEQSLDVDFDVIISQIAPIDLLLQRLGRLWRHAFRDPNRPIIEPIFHVLLPSTNEFTYGSTESVYFRELLLKSQLILDDVPVITLPQDFRSLIEKCYGTVEIPNNRLFQAEILAAEKEHLDENRKMRSKASLFLVSQPDRRTFSYALHQQPAMEEGDEGDGSSWFRATTRYGDDTTSVIMLSDPELIEAARLSAWPGISTAKRIMLQKVGLPSWWFGKDLSAKTPGEMFEGSGWLRNNIVLVVTKGRWRGQSDNGDLIIRMDARGIYISNRKDVRPH